MAINFQSPKVIAAGVASGLAITGGLFLFKPWLAFQNVSVMDEIPTISAPATTAADSSSDSASVTTKSDEKIDAPGVLAKGDFISHEHTTTGKASIVKLENGKYQLVFENLNTTNGPDVHVWVSAGEVVEGLAGFKSAQDHEKIDLGVIKGNQGNQVYDLPDDFDPTKWKSIDLWCDMFDVSFGAAPLNLEGEAQTAKADSSETAKAEAAQTGPVQLAGGDFISHEHTTTGKASIVKLPDGKQQLVFENLNTTNGPDVHVWVSAGEVVEGVAGFKSAQDKEKIDLGVIKGNQGNQVYDLPADFDVTKWKSIDLWCDMFDVSFGAAPLNA